MLLDFPKTHGPNRERFILKLLDQSPERFSYDWQQIVNTENGITAKFYVMSDAIKVDGIRINVTADTQQRIADKLNCSLLTAKICDLIWHNASIRVTPKILAISNTTEAMIRHSQIIDKDLSYVDHKNKIISTVGKDWIIDKDLDISLMINPAVDYGWHIIGDEHSGLKCSQNVSGLKGLGGKEWKVAQNIGITHNKDYTDYSHTCRLVSRECFINGKTMDLYEVLKDQKLAYLASHTGPLSIVRQPGVAMPGVVIFTPSLIDEIKTKL
jgi:hypothetical protein